MNSTMAVATAAVAGKNSLPRVGLFIDFLLSCSAQYDE